MDPSFEPRCTLGLACARSRPASRGANSLDIALEMAAVNRISSGKERQSRLWTQSRA